ncbi:transporter [Sulfurisoma sediminicola]|uniref:Outer membrane putative beta-barrel porin/alpha-amylase n=1 Tax=Sulfurisoma sediminicola TaxID=1381557 RepID=A0A497X808_9PROT|nr:transporter [Sulfurisoma sediminicola]RLJ61625.1 outer membrane putative beta-barrel porin/alpha-amylase [Sulfurisoma sediminicola]
MKRRHHAFLRTAAAAAMLLAGGCALAQEAEPRAYTNAPIGINFLIAGYARSEGGVAFDPSVPLTNAKLTTDAAILAYGRVLEIGGQSAKFNVVLPYASLKGTAEFAGKPAAREVSGYGDPKLSLAVNFLGAPALSPREFAGYRQYLVVGGSVQVSLPTGQYDHDKLVNIGTNRWSVTPGLGLSKALGPWALELAANATFYGDNTDFFGGKRREQEPIYSMQGHLIYNFAAGIWAALTATHYGGGRTTLDGVRGNDLQQNSRIGATLALPVDRHNSIKILASSGVYTRTGSDFDTVAIAWQHRWGAGF